MKNKLLIILLLVSIKTFSQVQKRFYVEDVKTIDYVTVKFCVNDSAKIDKVKVLKEKTTYKNIDIIEQLRNYLLSIEYYPNSKLKNNCYDSTFEFVNSKYENPEFKLLDSLKTKKFKTGDFKYLDVRYRNAKIERSENVQSEIDENYNAEFKITWSSTSEYELEYLKISGEENQDLIGKSIKVRIIDVLEDKYVYLSKLMDQPTLIGEIQIVE